MKKSIPYNKGNYYVDIDKRDFMDPEQLEWLRKDLMSTDKRCILFSHQSIDTEMENREQVQRVLEEVNEKSGFKKVVVAFSGHNHSNYTKEINGITYIQMNSASYVWIGKPTMTEKRYPEEINKKYSLMEYSMSYTKPLYGIVTVDKNGKITDVNLDTTYTKDGVETTKKTLGDAYGMYGNEYGSKVGEWYTQVEALEKNVVDNQGLDKVKLTDDGYTDTVSGCTIKIDALYEALENALNQAKK